MLRLPAYKVCMLGVHWLTGPDGVNIIVFATHGAL